MRSVTVYLAVLLGLTLVGCTWVKPTPEASKVRLVPIDRVADCSKIGGVTTSTVDKVVINRKSAKVKTELETLAKIEAAKMDADTIV
ncbi:MAG: DUF4156 domain-containing protein, partial [Arenicella sp.]|nr:DUF4156 domain-containing protein [Arenicella sp.]